MSLHLQTRAIRNQHERTAFKEHSVPLYLTSSFVFDDAEQMRARFAEEEEGNLYSRFSNPNTEELIQKIALLEGTETGWATATGMSAVFTSLAAFLSTGDEIVSCRSVFGSTHQLFTTVLPKWGVTTHYVDVLATEQEWESKINSNTKIIFAETPTNPGVELLDLALLGRLAKKHNVLLVIDNCFATPFLQQPAKYGADIIIHSATKYIDGQGRVLGGLIATSEVLLKEIKFFARHSGPAMSPFNAWVLSKSLETLSLRMEKHSSNAQIIAEKLEKHDLVGNVNYPFLTSHPQYNLAKQQMTAGGGIVAFEHKEGLAGGRNFLNKLNLLSLSANLGDSRSIATHPASTTHAKLSPEDRLQAGIADGLIRISVGLEHVDDIWNDIEQAL